MNEQQVNQLLEAMRAQTAALTVQSEAINRLAESNESLVALIIDNLDDGGEPENDSAANTYLSGKPVGR
ncbi:hypothetical protein O1V64_11100 [Rouxiella badensis]|nr:hypothetical protein O1V64_11100 [Rouxiella badensis]